MVAARELYVELPDAPVIPQGLPLVVAVKGFTDTGQAVEQFTEHVLSQLEAKPVFEFDLDELYDYRDRRPLVYFDQDHLASYQPPQLTVSLVRDELGVPFLLLHGVEPDLKWNAFTEAVQSIMADYAVTSFTWVQAIPMPAPHTRPLNVTVSGNRRELTEAFSVWRPQTLVPSNVVHLLEYRLSQSGVPTVGFVLLVPHYLGDNAYPDAAVKAVECVSAATGLILPSDELRESGRDFAHRLSSQVAESEELAQLVSTLEERHDAYMADQAVQSPLVSAEGDVPSAEQIAAEWERFLANRPANNGPASGSDSTSGL